MSVHLICKDIIIRTFRLKVKLIMLVDTYYPPTDDIKVLSTDQKFTVSTEEYKTLNIEDQVLTKSGDIPLSTMTTDQLYNLKRQWENKAEAFKDHPVFSQVFHHNLDLLERELQLKLLERELKWMLQQMKMIDDIKREMAEIMEQLKIMELSKSTDMISFDKEIKLLHRFDRLNQEVALMKTNLF